MSSAEIKSKYEKCIDDYFVMLEKFDRHQNEQRKKEYQAALTYLAGKSRKADELKTAMNLTGFINHTTLKSKIA